MADRKQLFVIDTDAGVDDAHAILMALAAPRVDVIGLTTVTGNTSAAQVAKNLLRLLRVVDRLDIPIYRGCEVVLMGGKKNPDYNYHGIDGFGDVPDPNPPDESIIKTQHGVQALLHLSRVHPGEITLVALGPLTNIAMAIRLDPDFGKRLKSCYVMGGNYRGIGNITPTAEFNFYMDPEAAHIVLSDLGCPITIACWELCIDQMFPWNWYEELVTKSSEVAKFIRVVEHSIIQRWYMGNKDPDSSNGQIDYTDIQHGYHLADEFAMAAACLDDVILDSQSAFASVDTGNSDSRGRMEIAWNGCCDKTKNVDIIKSVDLSKIKGLLVKAFTIR
ncbi:probable uridine nucleosidase 2 [Gigantopelta aegis]|uniref:probable uridine nucleosidase 2 n=1 Tax=Gigantopelta aegis TaxID=1735272 RepID=UPI001B88D842|nr:probable uridine nucleosidase 2 [Gigantopelta aegis]XP_041368238.1 probable uridine nucleosidase 2 [Gigantopelta aegis]XP_041368239.1 probable uridine nucleosidase 2 [Gigantopelta aegis]XP_041368240.1 probable uridine nucleosidase 2 [Gigantopelta aegis]XP_041368241.1 probable uridine nucleosidase 2 [Gigantopelta aegis]XP_041368242.1 probable uridine nucleosidase 2 [Gigantopelta aegis]XP_041368244.1 probable uridine nucleosidase 2 [Gigantopelta aegis]